MPVLWWASEEPHENLSQTDEGQQNDLCIKFWGIIMQKKSHVFKKNRIKGVGFWESFNSLVVTIICFTFYKAGSNMPNIEDFLWQKTAGLCKTEIWSITRLQWEWWEIWVVGVNMLTQWTYWGEEAEQNTRGKVGVTLALVPIAHCCFICLCEHTLCIICQFPL